MTSGPTNPFDFLIKSEIVIEVVQEKKASPFVIPSWTHDHKMTALFWIYDLLARHVDATKVSRYFLYPTLSVYAGGAGGKVSFVCICNPFQSSFIPSISVVSFHITICVPLITQTLYHS